MNICLAQIEVATDISANLEKIDEALSYAIEHDADILLTPEGSLSGYHNQFDGDEVAEALETIVRRATVNSMGLALGTCFFESDGKCYNQIRFYDKSGNYLGFHSKILRCGSWADPSVGEITYFACTDLNVFDFHGVPVGGLICNDLWANPACTPMPDPHLSQQLANMGAKIIFHAVNGGRNDTEFSRRVVRNFHESNLLMRGRSAKAHIATVDNCAPEHLRCSSQGGIVSPAGEWLYKLPEKGQAFSVFSVDTEKET
ncbi:MAG: hypothetical protein CMN78_05930 [Spirochaetales bacterium]|nr:hypothetical protein [Spirochaetales bacterium]